jgi:hypothetical protein
MGPSIEPQLRGALRGKLSDEARARIDALVARFQETLAMHAIVTMHYTNAPLMKVLTDFARQAGANLGIDDPAVAAFAHGRLATVNLDNADFWQALRAVKDASGLTPWIGQPGLMLTPASRLVFMQIDFSNKFARASGGLLIVPTEIREQRDMNYSTGKTSSVMWLMITVIPEPKLHVVGAVNFDWLKDCVDDKGNSLMPVAMNRRFFNPGFLMRQGPRQSFWPLQTNLNNEIPNPGTKIARLHGEVNLLVQARSQVFEIDDILRAHNSTTRDGPVSFTVLSCSRTPVNYQLSLLIGGITNNDPIIQDITNSAQLVDDKDQASFRQGCNTRPSAQGVNVDLMFPLTQDNPVKLRWEKTLEQKKLSIPFELDDLPLPAVR